MHQIHSPKLTAEVEVSYVNIPSLTSALLLWLRFALRQLPRQIENRAHRMTATQKGIWPPARKRIRKMRRTIHLSDAFLRQETRAAWLVRPGRDEPLGSALGTFRDLDEWDEDAEDGLADGCAPSGLADWWVVVNDLIRLADIQHGNPTQYYWPPHRLVALDFRVAAPDPGGNGAPVKHMHLNTHNYVG